MIPQPKKNVRPRCPSHGQQLTMRVTLIHRPKVEVVPHHTPPASTDQYKFPNAEWAHRQNNHQLIMTLNLFREFIRLLDILTILSHTVCRSYHCIDRIIVAIILLRSWHYYYPAHRTYLIVICIILDRIFAMMMMMRKYTIDCDECMDICARVRFGQEKPMVVPATSLSSHRSHLANHQIQYRRHTAGKNSKRHSSP